MRKLIASVILATVFSTTTFAGQWIQEGNEWKYERATGGFLYSKWGYVDLFYIDGNNDNIAEAYAIDSNGIMHHDEVLEYGGGCYADSSGILHKPDGSIMTQEINVNGKVNPESGKGIIKESIIDVFLKDSGYLKQIFQNEMSDRDVLSQYSLNFSDGSDVVVETVNDKVIYTAGKGILKNPNWGINDLLQALGSGTKKNNHNLRGDVNGYDYVWILQSDLPLRLTVRTSLLGNITLIVLQVDQPSALYTLSW